MTPRRGPALPFRCLRVSHNMLVISGNAGFPAIRQGVGTCLTVGAALRRRERRSFGDLLEWLDGHPLAMRLTLPRLDATDPAELLAALRGTIPLSAADTADATRSPGRSASSCASRTRCCRQAPTGSSKWWSRRSFDKPGSPEASSRGERARRTSALRPLGLLSRANRPGLAIGTGAGARPSWPAGNQGETCLASRSHSVPGPKAGPPRPAPLAWSGVYPGYGSEGRS